MDGVVVGKDKGRQVFETEVRKGIDPGLIEWTKGNTFKTRVFPIPARGTRTIRLGYVSEVIDSASGALYRLPLDYREPVGTFSVHVSVMKPAQKPIVSLGGPKGLSFDKTRYGFAAQASMQNVALTDDLVVSLPGLDTQPIHVEHALPNAADQSVYFAIRDKVQVPATTPSLRAPKRIALYWDASLSRANSDHKKQLAVLDGYLGSLSGSATVELVYLRDRAQSVRTFTLPGERAALRSTLDSVAYDGGTQLGEIGVVGNADINLVVSDGLSTFGEERPTALRAPTYVLSGGTRANHALLRYLAMTTGGAYFNLQRVPVADAASAIGKQVFSFQRAEAKGAEIADLYPRLRTPVTGTFHMAGKLVDEKAIVIAYYGIGNKTMASRRFLVRRSDAVPGDMLRRYWAQKKIDELLVFPDANEDEITRVGKQYSIVTPNTSLIVLERIEQYVENDIRPPASLPEMRLAYDRAKKDRMIMIRDARADKLRKVIAMWDEEKAWWRKRYSYPANFRYRERNSKKRRPSSSRARPSRNGAPSSVLMARRAPAEAESDAAPEAKAEAKKDDAARATGPTSEPDVQISAWNPDTPYASAIRNASARERFQVYVRQRRQHGTSPGFYLDSADIFRSNNQRNMALQVLSNLAELELENPALLRVLAHRLGQLAYFDLSVRTFEQVLSMRPEEPQSYRDLALLLARRAALTDRTQADRKADYERALSLLAQVVMGEWQRFDRIEIIALTELNNILPKARALGIADTPVDKRLIAHLDMDVRIVMTWDADLTDMDLHVVEPSNEEAYFAHNQTTIGGRVSRDFTRGYGPEVYAVRRAMKGTYKIKTAFFGSSAAALTGAVTLQVDIFTNFGRANEQRKSITLRLTEKKETFEVGNIRF